MAKHGDCNICSRETKKHWEDSEVFYYCIQNFPYRSAQLLLHFFSDSTNLSSESVTCIILKEKLASFIFRVIHMALSDITHTMFMKAGLDMRPARLAPPSRPRVRRVREKKQVRE